MRFKPLVGAIVLLAITFLIQAGAPAHADPQCPQPGSALCTLFQTLTPASDQKQLDEAADYLVATLADLDAQWTDWFLRSKMQEPWVQYTIVRPGNSVVTDCSVSKEPIVTDTQNAAYCSADEFQGKDNKTHKGRIVLPLVALYKIWNGDVFGSQIPNKARFGAAVITAHEFGHAVHQALADQLHVSGPPTMQNELLADCFAANWVHVQDTTGRLLPGDMDAALATIWAVGDFGFDKADHHGTPQERHDAFIHGLDGSPAKCMQAYWPQAFDKL